MKLGKHRFLGLDLAWSSANPSGAAVLDERGQLSEARSDLKDDAEILAWVRANLAPTTVIGIDMPTIVPNAVGYRPCERELAADFRQFHAAPYPANRKRFPDGGRARHLLDALAADGFSERLDLGPKASGRFAFEVFPHPSLVRLFGRASIFRYKKKPARSWSSVLEAWGEYRAALASLGKADPPLHLPSHIPVTAAVRRYKASDDLLDGITCAYIAAFLWRWGTAAPHTRVYGNLEEGYIAIPDRMVISQAANRGTA